MKRRLAIAAVVALGIIVAFAGPSAADHRSSRVEFFIGSPFVVAPPPYWYAPRPYVVYPSPPVVYEPPPPAVYVPPPPIWHYCRSYGAYYPSVPTCPEGWVLVPGR